VQPLALSDSQITSIMQLSRPLLPHQRIKFVELLATKLDGHGEIGDGELHRICRQLQRELFDPPDTGVGQPHHGRKLVARRSAVEA
jgi:hypothetical protein